MTADAIPLQPSNSRLLVLFAVKLLAFTILWIGLAASCAGTLAWPGLWAYIALSFGFVTVNLAAIMRKNPELLRARIEKHKGTKPFDKFCSLAISVVLLLLPIVAGLDRRLGGSAPPFGVIYIGTALFVAGCVPITWAMMVNPFLERTVRIQTERGHEVVTRGPYHVVRHPMYSGLIIHYLATAMILGSWWAWIPAIAMGVVLIVRTGLEDRTLHNELPGYAEYARTTPFRLLPGIW